MTTADVGVPLPTIDLDSEGFWAGAREHRLMAQRCVACDYRVFPPYPCCRRCGSMEMEWVPTSGIGHVYTWTTLFRSPRPEFEHLLPYTVIAVDVEGVDGRYPGRLVGTTTVEIGAKVQVQFEAATATVSIPVW